MCADIDECAAGQVAEHCADHGVCSGLHPAGNWSCSCEPGYKLAPNRTVCTCQYSLNRPSVGRAFVSPLFLILKKKWLKQPCLSLPAATHAPLSDSPSCVADLSL